MNRITKSQGLFNVIKYIYIRKGIKNKDKTFKSFFENGVSLPELICLLLNIPEIPNISKNPMTTKMKEENNQNAINFLYKAIDFPWKTKQYEDLQHIEIILRILNRTYFNMPLRTIIQHSNNLLKPLGITVHKKNDIFNGIYIIQLLHILTNNDVSLIDEFDYSKDVEAILSPIFQKYDIPFLLNFNSFTYQNQEYVFLQIKVIFDFFQDKIRTIVGSYDSQPNEADIAEAKKNDLIDMNISNTEKLNESYFINLTNIIASDIMLAKQFFNFDEIIQDNFIPYFLIHELSIDSFKNVKLKHNHSIEISIKNIEACIQFLAEKHKNFKFFYFDFQNSIKRSYSVRRLLREIFNLYFIKLSRKEMFERYKNITGDEQGCKRTNYIGSTILLHLAYFIKTGKRQYPFLREERVYDDLSNYCLMNSIPTLAPLDELFYNDEKPDDIDLFIYQLQILFNIIDKIPSRRFLEKLYTAQYKLSKVNVPHSFNVKNKYFQSYDFPVSTNKEEEEEEEEEMDKNKMRINEHPTTIKDRFKNDPSLKQKTIPEAPQHFWNPSFLYNLSQIKNGILYEFKKETTKNFYTDQKWIDEMKKIQKKFLNSNIKNQSLFTPNNSKLESKLYKIFYYDEMNEKWFFDADQYEQFSKDEHINIEGSNTPIISYIDSSEDDLISFNSNFINKAYPCIKHSNKSFNDIFVYALCGRALSVLNYEIDYTDKRKSSIKPVFLLLHIPNEKEKLFNIETITIQIYTFLSLISDMRIIILNKSFYSSQIVTMMKIYDIVDRNMQDLLTQQNIENFTNDITNDESESSYQSDIEEDFNETSGNNQKIIYNSSKLVFLFNDEMITQYNDKNDNFIDESEFFTSIKSKFDNQIIMNLINIKNHLTFKSFFDTLNFVCLKSNTIRSNLIHNFNCISDILCMSTRYIYMKQSSTIDSTIRERYKILNNSCDYDFDSLSLLQNEIENFSPQFDIKFKTDCEIIIYELKKEICNIYRTELQKELHQSATEELEHINYILHQKFFWEQNQLEAFRRSYITFLEEEYLSIIKTFWGNKYCAIVFEENKDILFEQIESDQVKIQNLFYQYIKLIKIKENPIEEELGDAKKKGTRYIMKEKENVREVKVTIEMNTDLKTFIKQDF